MSECERERERETHTHTCTCTRKLTSTQSAKQFQCGRVHTCAHGQHHLRTTSSPTATPNCTSIALHRRNKDDYSQRQHGISQTPTFIHSFIHGHCQTDFKMANKQVCYLTKRDEHAIAQLLASRDKRTVVRILLAQLHIQ